MHGKIAGFRKQESRDYVNVDMVSHRLVIGIYIVCTDILDDRYH